MRMIRLSLLLFCFIALPVFLTCISILSAREATTDAFNHRYQTRSSRLKAFFSFHAPSSLFYPSAIISLTDDNSTFFLARPAAFGPLLPSHGLDGELWVGRGFGEDKFSKNGEISISGWEFGCSDVPEWSQDHTKRADQPSSLDMSPKKDLPELEPMGGQQKDIAPSAEDKEDTSADETLSLPNGDDGTDDHLHYPLGNSNPAEPGTPGEPADKTKLPTHADIESLQESAEIAGKVVLLSRGGCGFLEKVKWAQRRGGIAVIVGDDERGAQLTTMYARGDTSNVTIPAVFTSFNAAHLLSSLVPQEQLAEVQSKSKIDGKGGASNPKLKNTKGNVVDGPTFTSTTEGTVRPTILPAGDSGQSPLRNKKGWVRGVLTKLGAQDESTLPAHSVEDSRRPPSSGNIDWVLLEDWDEEEPRKTPIKGQPMSTSSKTTVLTVALTKSTSRTHRPTGDDFVIGVQDWRDTDLVAPKPVHSTKEDSENKGADEARQGQSSTSAIKPQNLGEIGSLKGGSITPGSGEYDHDRTDMHYNGKGKGPRLERGGQQEHESHSRPASSNSWFRIWRSGVSEHSETNESSKGPVQGHGQSSHPEASNPKSSKGKSVPKDEEHQGLWVTMTPTDVSTSPFFDTLLVLVVSPLVTLTIVYALLLLRSRIRRRRWRAPKSVVEQLPVRTYHTMSTSSSTTSSQVNTPDSSSPNSPLLRSAPRSVSRTRPRSQTTTGVLTSSGTGSNASSPIISSSMEKAKTKSKPTKRKRYTGRQLECVVCLEEYVDGESRVMSLPCGHEFHADCITPWLTLRRRTCPICKGDVVRSLTRCKAGQAEDQTEEGEQTSADVQEQVAETVNESPSAAIPIPPRLEDDEGDSDVERQDVDGPVEGVRNATAPRSAWRNIVSGSVSALSGDTVWRSSPRDRSR